MLRIALALVALAVAVPLPALAQGKAQLDSVSIHLFLATSGTLSPDIETIKAWRPEFLSARQADRSTYGE